MQFRLIDSDWDRELETILKEPVERLRIVCPFIKRSVAARLLKSKARRIEVITRFDLRGFNDGVSDVQALKLFVDAGGAVKGVRGLHAKMYLVDSREVVVTSANLTESALRRNHEFGFVASEASVVTRCSEYFDDLWNRAGPGVDRTTLDQWDAQLRRVQIERVATHGILLPDYGVTIDQSSPLAGSSIPAPLPFRAFVKFFGQAANRVDTSTLIADEVARSGCHWACTYPRDKRPRRVRDGDIMLMARMVHSPKDYRVFGWGIASEHKPSFDDATTAEIMKRPFKERWPHYIRVHDAHFLDGRLSDGISLGEMMEALRFRSFTSTLRNHELGSGNQEPEKSLMQKPDIELTPEGYRWLRDRLEGAIQMRGMIDLNHAQFDRPS